MRLAFVFALFLPLSACAPRGAGQPSLLAAEPGRATYRFEVDAAVERVVLRIDGSQRDREYIDGDAREFTMSVVETDVDLTFFVKNEEGDDFGMFYAKPAGAAADPAEIPSERKLHVGSSDRPLYRRRFRPGHGGDEVVELTLEPKQK